MYKSSRVVPFRLVVDNNQPNQCQDHLLAKAVQAYWRACENESPDDAIAFLRPLKAGSPKGLAQKAQVLENMVETRRSAVEIAGFAAALADDALNVSRRYLNRVS